MSTRTVIVLCLLSFASCVFVVDVTLLAIQEIRNRRAKRKAERSRPDWLTWGRDVSRRLVLELDDLDCDAIQDAIGHRLVLELDVWEYDAIQDAIGRRQSLGRLPWAPGNQAGRALAEICRDWLTAHDVEVMDDDPMDDR